MNTTTTPAPAREPEAELILTSGKRTKIHPANGQKFQATELQNIVGGYIEIIQLPDGRAIVTNMEGRLMMFEVNPMATVIAGKAGRPVPEGIVGDVVLTDAALIE